MVAETTTILTRSGHAADYHGAIMSTPTPLLSLHRRSDALMGLYGPAPGGVAVVEAIDPIEVEYAALRTRATLLDRPERAVVEVRGKDAIEYLNRMLTQELRRDFEPYTTKRSFWLSRKGRIDADLRLIRLEDRLLIDLDCFSVPRLLKGEDGKSGLPSFVFAEDVMFADLSQAMHRLSLHGPAAAAIVAEHTRPLDGPSIDSLTADRACRVMLGPAEIVVDRWDSAGEIGLELTFATEHAELVYQTLSRESVHPGLHVGTETPSDFGQAMLATRGGWHGYNLARLESGTALFNLDFGPTSLPHETGRETLLDRVSFKKGCYLGQEVVARMESLGHPKQRLVGLRIERPAALAPHIPSPFLVGHDEPQTGSVLVDQDSPDSASTGVVGAITSAGMSPMLGSASVAFAMVKWSHATEGRKLFVQTAGHRLPATVHESLKFWQRT